MVGGKKNKNKKKSQTVTSEWKSANPRREDLFKAKHVLEYEESKRMWPSQMSSESSCSSGIFQDDNATFHRAERVVQGA